MSKRCRNSVIMASRGPGCKKFNWTFWGSIMVQLYINPSSATGTGCLFLAYSTICTLWMLNAFLLPFHVSAIVYSPYIPISWLLPSLDQISTGREKAQVVSVPYCAFTSSSSPGEAPSSQHGKVEEPTEVDELTSLTGLTVTAASGNAYFLLCLHPAFTDNKLELTGGAWSSISFRWSKCLPFIQTIFSYYKISKNILKSITFHPVVLIRLPCVLCPPQLRAATLEGASARRTRRGDAATRSTILVKQAEGIHENCDSSHNTVIFGCNVFPDVPSRWDAKMEIQV